MGEERESEDGSDECEVVDAEVGVVLTDARGGVGERIGFREGGSVGELGPGAALRESVCDLGVEAVDEGAEGWSGGGSGGGGGGGGGGLRGGGGEDG